MMVVVVVLAVAAGDGNHVAGADLKEHLHLAGEGTALPPRRQRLRHVRPQARCRKITSCVRPSRYPSPQMGVAPAASSSSARGPSFSRPLLSQAVTAIPSASRRRGGGVLLTPIPTDRHGLCLPAR